MDVAFKEFDQPGCLPNAALLHGMLRRGDLSDRSRTVAHGFDAIGRRTSLTDQAGAVTTFAYDNRDLVTGITDPLNRATSLAYDDTGRLVSRTDRNADTISFAYTSTGKTETITYPDLSSVGFTYDTDWENVASMTDALGTSHSFTLDANGNRVEEVRQAPQVPSSLVAESRLHSYNLQKHHLQTAGADSLGKRGRRDFLQSNNGVVDPLQVSIAATGGVLTAEETFPLGISAMKLFSGDAVSSQFGARKLGSERNNLSYDS